MSVMPVLQEEKESKRINFCSLILCITILLYIISHVIISLEKEPSLDELYTYYLFKDKSFSEFLPKEYTTINLMPQGYFLMLSIIDHVFDLGMTGMRIPNLILSIMAIIIFFLLLRTRYEATVSSLTTSVIFCHFTTLAHQLVEARPYMLFLVLSLFQILIIIQRAHTGKRYLIYANAIVSFLLPFSFYFGGIYSSICCLGLVFLYMNNKEFDKYLVLSFAVGWGLFFVCCTSVLQAQHQGRGEMFWYSSLESFRFWDLHNLYAAFLSFPYAVLPPLILLGAFLRKLDCPVIKNYSENNSTLLINVIIAGWLTVPLVIFGLCKFRILHTFEIRFFIPTCFAFGWLIAHIIENYLNYISTCKFNISSSRFRMPYFTAIFVIFLGSVLHCTYFVASYYRSLSSTTSPDAEYARIDAPILTYNHNQFFHLSFNNSDFDNPTYLLLDYTSEKDFFRQYSPKLNTLSLESEWNQLQRFCFLFNANTIDVDELINVFKDKGYNVKGSMNLNLPFTPNALFFTNIQQG